MEDGVAIEQGRQGDLGHRGWDQGDQEIPAAHGGYPMGLSADPSRAEAQGLAGLGRDGGAMEETS